MDTVWFLLPYLASTLATAALAFVKAFQAKNIVGGHYKAAFSTSWIVTSCEVATVTFVVHLGWTAIFSAGLGGAFGTISAMAFHDKLFKLKRD